jgi:hypothetical protein
VVSRAAMRKGTGTGHDIPLAYIFGWRRWGGDGVCSRVHQGGMSFIDRMVWTTGGFFGLVWDIVWARTGFFSGVDEEVKVECTIIGQVLAIEMDDESRCGISRGLVHRGPGAVYDASNRAWHRRKRERLSEVWRCGSVRPLPSTIHSLRDISGVGYSLANRP